MTAQRSEHQDVAGVGSYGVVNTGDHGAGIEKLRAFNGKIGGFPEVVGISSGRDRNPDVSGEANIAEPADEILLGESLMISPNGAIKGNGRIIGKEHIVLYQQIEMRIALEVIALCGKIVVIYRSPDVVRNIVRISLRTQRESSNQYNRKHYEEAEKQLRALGSI